MAFRPASMAMSADFVRPPVLTHGLLEALDGIRHGFFTREGGDAYLKELPKAEMHRLDSGHFAVEDCLDYISKHIHRFYRDVVAPGEEADPRGRALIVTRIA